MLLRRAGIELPILCVGACFEQSAADTVKYGITLKPSTTPNASACWSTPQTVLKPM